MKTNTTATIEEMLEETVPCKKCGCKVSELAMFPGGICVTCHESKFNAQVKANGGVIPRPNFFKSISK